MTAATLPFLLQEDDSSLRIPSDSRSLTPFLHPFQVRLVRKRILPGPSPGFSGNGYLTVA